MRVPLSAWSRWRTNAASCTGGASIFSLLVPQGVRWIDPSRTERRHPTGHRGDGEFELAAVCNRAAVCMWNESSPPRSAQANDKLETLVTAHPGLHTYLNEAAWKAEGAFERWLSDR